MKSISFKHNRVRLLVIILMSGALLLITRLFHIQVLSHSKYAEMARKEQIKVFVLPAERGLIYAMDGPEQWSPLVLNETVYTAFIDPRVVNQPSKLKHKLKEVAGENLVQFDKFDEKVKNATSRYEVVAMGLSRKQAEQLKSEKFKGLGFQTQTRRVYPEGELAAQVLGFVNSDGGQYGVEGGLNKRLAGQDGRLESVTDVADVPLTIGDRNIDRPAVDGDNLVLSIDKNIQAAVEQALVRARDKFGADKVSALVLNPNNGQIMAAANLPTFNPGQFHKVTDATVFNNRCLMEPYEPGSVIKTLTFAAGLSDGLFGLETRFYNADIVQVGDRKIYNAYKGVTGSIPFRDIMRYSLNTGMVEVLSLAGNGQINRKSRDWLYDYFSRRYGFGARTGVELPDEAGVIISPEQEEGNAVRYANMSFGQGFTATMLQVSSAFAAVVNGGTYYQPTILQGVLTADGQLEVQEPVVKRQGVITPQASELLRQVTDWARHTGIQGKDDPVGFQVGGKTGTSETIKDGQYVKDETVASYLGYGGGSKPEYVIMTQISATGKYMEGNIQAVALFNDISNWLIKYLKIQPKG